MTSIARLPIFSLIKAQLSEVGNEKPAAHDEGRSKIEIGIKDHI